MRGSAPEPVYDADSILTGCPDSFGAENLHMGLINGVSKQIRNRGGEDSMLSGKFQ